MSGSAALYMKLSELSSKYNKVVELAERLGSDQLLEELADLEHARWSHWMKYQLSKCVVNPDGSATIPDWAVERWTKQMTTDYADLTEKEKESDRVEARKTLEIINGQE